MVRFTRARTHVHMCMYFEVYNSKVLVWYDTWYLKLRIFPIWRIFVTCTEDMAMHRVCTVYAHSYIQQEEQNIWQPSRMALNNSSTAVIDTKCYTNSNALLFVRTACCGFCCARAAYALILKSSDYVSYSSRFIFRHRKMPPASFWYHTYSSKVLIVAQQRRQQCAWCIR